MVRFSGHVSPLNSMSVPLQPCSEGNQGKALATVGASAARYSYLRNRSPLSERIKDITIVMVCTRARTSVAVTMTAESRADHNPQLALQLSKHNLGFSPFRCSPASQGTFRFPPLLLETPSYARGIEKLTIRFRDAVVAKTRSAAGESGFLSNRVDGVPLRQGKRNPNTLSARLAEKIEPRPRDAKW